MGSRFRDYHGGVHQDGLAVPTFKEEFGGVTAIIKRELFQAIQHGGSVINKRDDLDHDPETMSSLAQKLGISDSTVKRELKVLVKTGWIKHFGPDRGGRWLVIKNQNKSK